MKKLLFSMIFIWFIYTCAIGYISTENFTKLNSIDKETRSQDVILMQTKRISSLELKLDKANDLIHDRISEVELREKLLDSTADKLQVAINDLANIEHKLDVKKHENYNLNKEISKLEVENERLRDLLKLPDRAPHKSFWDLFKREP